MSTLGFFEFSIPPESLEDSSNYRYIGTLSWSARKKHEDPRLLSREINSRVLKISASFTPKKRSQTSQRLYRGGFINQIIGQTEAHSEAFKIGDSFVCFPILNQAYQVSVWPHKWLPNLKVRVDEYVGPISPPESLASADSPIIQQFKDEFVWFSNPENNAP